MTKHFGLIQFSGEDMKWPTLKYDRLAIGESGELLLASIVAPTQIVKGIRGWLNTNKRGTAQAAGAKVKKSFEEDWQLRDPGTLWKLPDGYSTETHRLQYGLAHALYTTRTPGFLKSISEEALWQELNTPRFTTPLLRSWMPWVTHELQERSLLVESDTYRCRCGSLHATTADLDGIVSDGIRGGQFVLRPVGVEPATPSVSSSPIAPNRAASSCRLPGARQPVGSLGCSAISVR